MEPVKRAAERLSWCGIIISAIIKTRMYSFARRPRSLTATQPHSKPTPRGIDFKNPFTMSKRKQKLPQTAACHSGSDVFIKPGNMQEAGRYSTTLPYASAKWWSLSGSNR